jgi:hypothetical protein
MYEPSPDATPGQSGRSVKSRRVSGGAIPPGSRMVESRKSNTNPPKTTKRKTFYFLNDQMVTRHDDRTQNAFGLGQPSHLLALCPDKRSLARGTDHRPNHFRLCDPDVPGGPNSLGETGRRTNIDQQTTTARERRQPPQQSSFLFVCVCRLRKASLVQQQHSPLSPYKI